MKTIAIIPARSGSKGIKDKNIKLLNGKPLLAYTIESAEKSGIFDEIMVSTDSEEYAEIAKAWGANVPFLRSKELSRDKSSSWDVVKEVLLKYKNLGNVFETIVLLQPTSPLRTHEDIVKAYDEFVRKKANSIISVCESEHSPKWMNTLPKDKSMKNFIEKENMDIPRQNIEKFYRINGSIYISKVDYLMQCGDIYNSKSYAFIMDKIKSVDIDEEIDFLFAEFILKDKKK